MIYEWECKQCTMRTEVERGLDESMIPPSKDEGNHKFDCTGAVYKRVFSSSTPFETLRDQGQFVRPGSQNFI